MAEVSAWAAERPRLIGLAYRITGTGSDAEDLVQEAYARLSAGTQVQDPAAWLTTVTARLAIDHLRSARVRRETYVGPWLPEPFGDPCDGPEEEAIMAESISTAMMVVMETMSPLERAAFVLHDVFGYSHDQVAGMLQRTPASVRQTTRRARRHVEARRPRFEVDQSRRRAVGQQFLAAAEGMDLEGLLALMSPDVVFRSDGGGVVQAARREVRGPERVVRFLAGLADKVPGARLRPAWMNASPAIRLLNGNGALIGVMTVQVGPEGHVTELNLVVNPEKLAATD